MTGEFLADVGRDGFVVSSKYGRTAAREPAAASVGNHRKAMRAEVEGSLRRLRTDRIDIYFAHFDDGVTPVEEIMRGFEDLASAGKIIHVGLSNFPAWRIASAATLAELRGWAPVAVLQLQYNLLERAADREHLPLARARGMGLMGWSPLAGGVLTGKHRPREPGRDPGSGEAVAPEDRKAEAIIAAVLEIAAGLGCEPASVALAWLGAKAITPVIGPRTRDQLAANLASAGLELTEAQTRRLDEASERPLGYPYDLLARERGRMGIADARTGAIL